MFLVSFMLISQKLLRIQTNGDREQNFFFIVPQEPSNPGHVIYWATFGQLQYVILFVYCRAASKADMIISHKDPVTCCKYNPSFKQVVTCCSGSVSFCIQIFLSISFEKKLWIFIKCLKNFPLKYEIVIETIYLIWLFVFHRLVL